MKIRNTITTNDGITIDPDDVSIVEIVEHQNYFEIIYSDKAIFCNNICSSSI